MPPLLAAALCAAASASAGVVYEGGLLGVRATVATDAARRRADVSIGWLGRERARGTAALGADGRVALDAGLDAWLAARGVALEGVALGAEHVDVTARLRRLGVVRTVRLARARSGRT
jgi:hypothetical protein